MLYAVETPAAKLLWLSLFAVAMALVEAAIVVHLRTLYYPPGADGLVRPLFPLVLMGHRDLFLELGREAATVAMLLAVACLAERSAVRRFAAFVFLFGLWDLFYYAWLKIVLGWPSSMGEWDVLFLIPWPWFGPWITPAVIALLFTAWGGWILRGGREPRLGGLPLLFFLFGALAALAAFLLPGAGLLPGGEAAFDGWTPERFPWTLWSWGVLLMAGGLWAARGEAGAKER